MSSDPIKRKADAVEGSENEVDYQYGFSTEEIHDYIDTADKFHRLYTFWYIGDDDLSPYLMKMIDVVPVQLTQLPFHSLMRTCTEAGEHKHFENAGVFYHHTLRGGGRHNSSVLMLSGGFYLTVSKMNL